FAKLAEEYSQDGGSNTNGGLYENVSKGQMISVFQNWCYEDGRQPGDTGVVYYSSTGAHVMYFVGYGDTPYWQSACENAMKTAASNEWQQSLVSATTAEINASGMKNVG
ncbi:MAG: peptidyl-prolyl cis-trans isomerase, partial [Oscillospiraceae bacterium]|nr:peptidyl-prolyl cis-trans isomerase [Oscillospiraceae bacterium]